MIAGILDGPSRPLSCSALTVQTASWRLVNTFFSPSPPPGNLADERGSLLNDGSI